MKNKNLWATFAGLAMIGAGVGAAFVYFKKRQPKETMNEEIEDEPDEETCACSEPERTYTVLTETAEKDTETAEEDTEAAEETAKKAE